MRGRALPWALRGLLLAALAVLAWTAVVLLTVRDDLGRAQVALEQARGAQDAAEARIPLAAAERELRVVTGRLDQPGPALAAAVPLLGRSVGALARTSQAALAVTSGAGEVLRAVEDGGPLLVDGRVDTDRLREVERALARAAERSTAPVAELVAQPLGLVPGRVADPARAARSELAHVPEDLARAAAGLRGLRGVLGADAPQDLLLLLENNAELRGTGGIVTVFAEARADDGRLTIRSFRDVEDVADSAQDAQRVPAPPDFTALYGPFLADTTLWKNTNMSPDVPTSSDVLADVALASTGRRPDALIWLDVPAIAAVLRATGPATLPDGDVLRADDVVTRLLSTAYLEADDTNAGQAERRGALSAAADAVLGDLLGAGVVTAAPATLARELLDAAAGRHLALWSADPATQAELVRARVAGAVEAGDGDLSTLTVHNLGGGDADGNKLDFYGRRQSTLSVRVGRDEAVVEQELALRNTAPARGLPVYVAGRVTPSISNSFVTIALPADAELVSYARDGQRLGGGPRPAGDHAVLTDVVSLTPGETATWRVRYRLPLQDGRYALRLFPQPLVVDAGLAVQVGVEDGLQLLVPPETAAVDGVEVQDGALRLSGPFSVVTRLDVRAAPPGRLARLRAAVVEFWSSPVPLP